MLSSAAAAAAAAEPTGNWQFQKTSSSRILSTNRTRSERGA